MNAKDSTKIARFIKNLETDNPNVNRQALYRLEPPLDSNSYVIVSGANVVFSGPETYIFPATPEGEFVSMGELDGSYRGGLDHYQALAGAGYSLEGVEPDDRHV